ncbi:MAG: L,D-transpeptidase family protein [Fimbriimonadaceae bacterium]|nr:L,D-transpeptidase family protein [Fimbriimonadaceae bacterium]QYK54918.1 MAG: L,D-transpeptidase family protein [Fimbriimonadaceae bacterium]
MVKAIWIVVGVVPTWAYGDDQPALDAVTFYGRPGNLYVSLRPAAKALGLDVSWYDDTQEVGLGETRFSKKDFVTLFDGTKLLSFQQLKRLGVNVEFDATTNTAKAVLKDKSFVARPGEKRVEVSIREQKLKAWQGETLVMETNISSGRRGNATPQGKFNAGPYRSRMHYSRLYDNAPMPYSVQINGHVFIHGYSSVPRYPASHGCIRMPLYGRNAARYFYEWVDAGTPVAVQPKFSDYTAKKTEATD